MCAGHERAERSRLTIHRGKYKCEATSLEGFIQQLAVAYVARGYLFCVTGCVPKRISAGEHDRRMLAKFDVAMSKWSRYRRRRRTGPGGRPLACVQYLRHEDFWVLLATHGEHYFFTEHAAVDEGLRLLQPQYRDIREQPIQYGGYSVSSAKRTSVRISERAYRELKSHFVGMALGTSRQSLEREFGRAPFEPYGGVTRQMFAILRAVNRVRKTAGLSLVPRDCIRVRRQVVRPFDDSPIRRISVVNDEQFPLAA